MSKTGLEYKICVQKNPDSLAIVTPHRHNESLLTLIQNHRAEALILLHQEGALLFRGFAPPSEDQFLTFVTKGLGWKPWNAFNQSQLPSAVADWMRRYFEKLVGGGDYRKYLDKNMVELGQVENAIQGPHVEGGISAVRARYLALCCFEPSKHLAETAVADLTSVFRDLSDRQKNKYVHAWNRFSYLTHRKINNFDRLLLRMSPFRVRMRSDGYAYLDLKKSPFVCETPELRLKCLQPWAFARNTQHMVFEAAIKSYQGRGDLKPDTAASQMNLHWNLSKANDETLEWTSEEQRTLFESIFKKSILVNWQKGDVLLLDNLRSAHWRMNGEQGSRRLIQIQAEPFDSNLLSANSYQQHIHSKKKQ